QDVEEENQLPLVALLQKLKTRRALFVECDDLSVENQLRDLDLADCFRDGWKSRREVELVATPHRELAVDDRDDRAKAVVLHLFDPVRLVRRRRVGQRREHRREEFAEELFWSGHRRATVYDSEGTTCTSSNPSSNAGGASFFA